MSSTASVAPPVRDPEPVPLGAQISQSARPAVPAAAPTVPRALATQLTFAIGLCAVGAYFLFRETRRRPSCTRRSAW